MTYLNQLAAQIHAQNYKWWHDADGKRLDRNFGELLCLVHSEISEALEGDRKSLMDDHLPEREMVEVELADAIIRILDICHARGYDIDGAIEEKLAYNRVRADHKLENRMATGGKKY